MQRHSNLEVFTVNRYIKRGKYLLLFIFVFAFHLLGFSQTNYERLYISPSLISQTDQKIIEILSNQFELLISNENPKPIIQNLTIVSDTLQVEIATENGITEKKIPIFLQDVFYPNLWITLGTLLTLTLLYFYRF